MGKKRVWLYKRLASDLHGHADGDRVIVDAPPQEEQRQDEGADIGHVDAAVLARHGVGAGRHADGHGHHHQWQDQEADGAAAGEGAPDGRHLAAVGTARQRVEQHVELGTDKDIHLNT